MKKKLLIILSLFFILTACGPKKEVDRVAKAKRDKAIQEQNIKKRESLKLSLEDFDEGILYHEQDKGNCILFENSQKAYFIKEGNKKELEVKDIGEGIFRVLNPEEEGVYIKTNGKRGAIIMISKSDEEAFKAAPERYNYHYIEHSDSELNSLCGLN